MDDDLVLPPDTLKILNEFLHEKKQREQDELNNVERKAGKDSNFEENWQLSQFWYSESTKKTFGDVARKLKNESGDPFAIALLSCPSLYGTIKDIHPNVHIFEFDQRFAAFGDDFVHYDFNNANSAQYLEEYVNCFDLIIADPPFLSEECISKMSTIILRLQKPRARVIFCSGKVVEPWLTECLDIRKCAFCPQHERNLGNEFVAYANFDLDEYLRTESSPKP